MKRRTAIAALPLGILGLTAAAKGITGNLTSIQIYPHQPQDENAPPDVTINTIAEWMRHYPDWQHALIKRVDELENCDLWDLKERAITIMDSEDYPQATRKRVERALTIGNNVAALEAVVLEAERKGGEV